MGEIMDIRLHHHLAQEFYRQQMLQRIPGNHWVWFFWEFSLKQLEIKIFVLNIGLATGIHQLGKKTESNFCCLINDFPAFCFLF